MKRLLLTLAFIACGICSASSQAGTLTLADYRFNVDGTVSDPLVPVPIGIGFSGFPTLGTITATFNSPGSHYFGVFLDYDIDDTTIFYNETGLEFGTPAVGLSWEIDEPGYSPSSPGNLLSNFQGTPLSNFYGTLDNTNNSFSPDDVSMALAWNFTLAADEKATITMLVSETAPSSGFYLTQTDPDANYSIYFSSSLDIVPTGGGTVPEPSSWLVILGLAAASLKMRRKVVKV